VGNSPAFERRATRLLIVIIATLIIVLVSVMIHYEALFGLFAIMKRVKPHPRYEMELGVVGALLAHSAEVLLFALGYYLLVEPGTYGALEGTFAHSLRDYTYFSFSVYSSLGFGDIVPTGSIRFMAGMEVLTGLVLIAWTASFLYIHMQKFWEHLPK
jgi:hypothetical protein